MVKASKLETVGAWLRLWTPPRDVVVPPVPWRTLAGGAALLAVAAVAIAVLVAPRIDDAKTTRAERQAREVEARADARRARLRAEQQPRFGRLPQGETRNGALVAVEAAIGEDARDRFSRKATDGTCRAAPGVDQAAAKVAYNCLSGLRAIVGGGDQEGARGTLGIPYRAVLDFGAGRYAFCKTNPIPGEQIVPDPRKLVTLPRACQIPPRR